MEILKAEIARKRKELEDKELINQGKKYFKRGDLAAIEKEEYLSKYAQVKESEKDNQNQANGNNNESQDLEDGENINGLTILDVAASDTDAEPQTLPRCEVILRLRERGEPILMYGESELEAFKRLRRCEILEPEVNRGFRNDFQEAMEKVDQDYLDELLANGNETDPAVAEIRDKTDLTYEEIKDMSKFMGRGNRELDMKVVMSFLQMLLKMWGEQLNSRSSTEKRGTRGKMAGATFTQTQVYLKPLLRKLKNHSLPEDISDSLTEIIRHLLNRYYLMASDAYLQMAIGNAPWPIGVTMVGIHARTGREKIFSKNVAHVMNDETQRKYIQALKRLMTKCQEYFPTDPSRCVEYQAFGSPSQPPTTN